MKDNPLVYLFRKTWQYSAHNRRNIVKYWTMFIIANIFIVTCHPLIMAKVMNTIQKEGITSENIWFLCMLLVGAVLANFVFWCLHGPARVIERCNAFITRSAYLKHLLGGVLNLPLEWHADHHSGDTIDKTEKGAMGVYSFASESFQVLSMAIKLIVSYCMLAYFSRPAGIIVLCMVGIAVWITMRFDKVIIGNYKHLNKAENQISASLYDAIGNITTVIILRVEKNIFDSIVSKINGMFALYRKNTIDIEIKWFLTSMCATIMSALVLGVYFYQNIGTSQGILIGSVFLLIKYLDEMADTFFNFTSMYGEVLQRKARVANAEELAQDFRSESMTNHVLPPTWKEIKVEGLNFSYVSGTEGKVHLDNLNFSIKRGRRIAFVGKSGCGKSTLLKIIRELYHPNRMKLLVDGVVIPDGFAGISRAIAMVPQEPEIFATTIRENITLGVAVSDKRIKYFTDIACFSDVVEELPHKLDSSINEKGVNLSVGQKQRLGLARGLLVCADKDIALLDEPTSSLDKMTEEAVYRKIFAEFQTTTIISPIHRLYLLPLFDEIFMFDSGRIVGSGTLDELLKTCPEFASLYGSTSDTSQP